MSDIVDMLCWGLSVALLLGAVGGFYIGKTWPRRAVRVVVTHRADDFQACIDGQPERWGCGGTADAAVGSLIGGWPEAVGCEIERRFGLG